MSRFSYRLLRVASLIATIPFWIGCVDSSTTQTSTSAASLSHGDGTPAPSTASINSPDRPAVVRDDDAGLKSSLRSAFEAVPGSSRRFSILVVAPDASRRYLIRRMKPDANKQYSILFVESGTNEPGPSATENFHSLLPDVSNESDGR